MDTSPRPTPAFRAVLCATDNSASGIAARRQAAWVADDEHAVTFVPARAVTMATPEELLHRCSGHDLLVIGADADEHALVRHVPIPVLFARWCETGADVTDAILVAVGPRAGAARAAELAGRLARRHKASVSLVAVPGGSHELTRALAAAGRIVLQATGSAPRIVGDVTPAWVALPRAAAASQASLIVLGIGDDRSDRDAASDIARFARCSVLVVPAPVPARPRRFEPVRARRHAIPVQAISEVAPCP
jgi:hypothetical protein